MKKQRIYSKETIGYEIESETISSVISILQNAEKAYKEYEDKKWSEPVLEIDYDESTIELVISREETDEEAIMRELEADKDEFQLYMRLQEKYKAKGKL